jgi:excisionase family DNA binding protein
VKKPSREAEYRPAVPASAEGAEDSQALELRPLVVDTLGVARLLGLSERTVRALNASGRLPRPLALGGRRLWSRRELEEWVDAGTPGRDRWEAHGRGSLGKRTHGRG